MSVWKKTEDILPPENKYVIGKHSRGTWRDRNDQKNVNTVIVSLRKGMSLKEREALINGTEEEIMRSRTWRSEDQGDNNDKPYYFDTFGPDSFFGQDIPYWTEIPDLDIED